MMWAIFFAGFATGTVATLVTIAFMAGRVDDRDEYKDIF